MIEPYQFLVQGIHGGSTVLLSLAVYAEEVLDKCFLILYYIDVKEFLNMNVNLIAVDLQLLYFLHLQYQMNLEC